ncbi:MAG: D-aminoacylase [Calditrichaeota bacterium]|nr:D-aminoacylase [Calditrichota bacterium]
MFKKITLIFALTLLFLFSCQTNNQTYDLIIRSGKIVDGAKNPFYYADIGIRGERIAAIGDLSDRKAKKIIDAKNLYVTPGFIDVHTHTDRLIDSLTQVKNYLLQGVTTVVGGNCGGSRYPLNKLFEKLEKKGIGINFASLVGHNTIRSQVMGAADRQPSPEELEQMKKLVDQEMRAGAIGLSTGLAYVPGRYSKTKEIIELAKMIAPYRGVYTSHLRNQGKGIKRAIEEAIRIGREAGVRVELSHIKLANDAVWGRYEFITDPVENARKEGREVYMDQYPYTATSSGFSSSFRGWVVAGGTKAFIDRMKNPATYEKAKQGLIQRRFVSARGINKLEKIYVAYNKNHHEYEGKNLAEILAMLGKDKTVSNAADLVIQMTMYDHPRGIFFQMDEKDVQEIMKKPYNMIASDGKIEIPGVEVPHPRAYGTFPRIIARYVREKKVLSLTDAIRKMTSLPAQAMGFYQRGLLKPGCFADIVIFDFEKIKDNATFQQPHQYPSGISYIIVNGKIAARDGKIVFDKAGKILYGNGKK